MLSSLICRFRNMYVDNKWGSCFRFLWHSRKVSSKTCSRVGNKRGIPKLPLISLINIAHMKSGGGVSKVKLFVTITRRSFQFPTWGLSTLVHRHTILGFKKHQSWVNSRQNSLNWPKWAKISRSETKISLATGDWSIQKRWLPFTWMKGVPAPLKRLPDKLKSSSDNT